MAYRVEKKTRRATDLVLSFRKGAGVLGAKTIRLVDPELSLRQSRRCHAMWNRHRRLGCSTPPYDGSPSIRPTTWIRWSPMARVHSSPRNGSMTSSKPVERGGARIRFGVRCERLPRLVTRRRVLCFTSLAKGGPDIWVMARRDSSEFCFLNHRLPNVGQFSPDGHGSLSVIESGSPNLRPAFLRPASVVVRSRGSSTSDGQTTVGLYYVEPGGS